MLASASPDSTNYDDVDVWIERCTLNVKWASENEENGCRANMYRLKLYHNSKEISTADTKALKYSYNGIDSESTYQVEVTPVLRCDNSSLIFQSKRMKTISAIPASQQKYITRNVSEKVVLECPLNGAYQPINVKWQHDLGAKRTTVRSFSSSMINLQSVSYRDMGKYTCVVEYNPCGNTGISRNSTSSLVLSLNGPPLISNYVEATRVRSGQNMTLALNVISFPPPYGRVIIVNQKGNRIFENTVSFEPKYMPLLSYGRSVELNGYISELVLQNITEEWFGTNNVFVFNNYGNHSVHFTVEGFTDEDNFIVKFLKKNIILLAGLGGGILVLIIIVIVIVITCDTKRRKRRENVTLDRDQNDQPQAESLTGNTTNGQHIYARPFSFGKYKEQDSAEVKTLTDRDYQIELDRRQCASLYSYGGFSVNEFQDDELMYDNQFAPEYK
ncbi:uncharacterized protein LOC125678978 isoform X3 [Ostrea edulis]|nr:uncharacterized protein LOC125678978 isoform X3 [Ostrea edulis]